MVKHLKSSIAAKKLIALLVLVTVANVSCEEEAQETPGRAPGFLGPSK